jgi:hypothetical protein
MGSLLTFCGAVADSLELLYGNMRVPGEQYHVPIVVTHGGRAIAAPSDLTKREVGCEKSVWWQKADGSRR